VVDVQEHIHRFRDKQCRRLGGGGGLILAELQNYVLQTHSFSVKDLTACIRPSFLDGGDGM
jgi:hypothetical protein